MNLNTVRRNIKTVYRVIQRGPATLEEQGGDFFLENRPSILEIL